MTVGKIYCAKLIYENYRHLKKQGKESFKVFFNLLSLVLRNLAAEDLAKSRRFNAIDSILPVMWE